MLIRLRLYSIALALLAIPLAGPDSHAQQSARCWALEQELANYDTSPAGNPQQLSRIERAYAKQLQVYEVAERRAEQIGCRKQGFLFFQPSKPAECRQLDAKVAEARNILDQLAYQREQLLASSASNPGKQRILQLLGQNQCGPQYEQYARSSQPGLFSNWFDQGNDAGNDFGNGPYHGGNRLLGDAPSYRTVCVRSCDGYYFPISFATVPERFDADAGQCQAMCPTASVELYVYENPGATMKEAVSLAGQSYLDHPNAFLYRNQYVKHCSCNPYTLALEASEPDGAELQNPVTANQGADPLAVDDSATDPALGAGGGAPGGLATITTGQGTFTLPADGQSDAPGVNVFRPGVNIFRPNGQPNAPLSSPDPSAAGAPLVLDHGRDR